MESAAKSPPPDLPLRVPAPVAVRSCDLQPRKYETFLNKFSQRTTLGHFLGFTRRTIATTLPRTSASIRFRSLRSLLEVVVQGRTRSIPFCKLQAAHERFPSRVSRTYSGCAHIGEERDGAGVLLCLFMARNAESLRYG